MRRVLLALMVGIFLLFVVGWMLISAPFLGHLRASFAQYWLDKVGAGLTLSGPVSISLGEVVHITAEGIKLHGMPGAVQLAKVEADVSFDDLLNSAIDPTNIVITGASAELVRDAQGNLISPTKVNVTKTDTPPASGPEQILAALSGKTVRLIDSHISLQDQISNFAFDARLATLELQGDTGNGVTALQGTGTINGQPLDLTVSVAKDAPLSVTLVSGATKLSLVGEEGSKGLSGGLSGRFSAQSSDLSQTLKILQLEPTLTGTASAQAILGQAATGDISLTGIDVSAALDSGQSAQISGSIGNLSQLDDADIAIDLALYPAGQEPAPARLVKDLRLTAVQMTLAGPLRGDTRRSMKIATNGFEINTAGIGPAPVKFSKISRGQAGELAIGSLSIQIGPVEAPWLTLQGQVDDMLKLEGLSLAGQANFPMSTIAGAGNKKLPTELGRISGAFKVSGSIQAVSLTEIKLTTRDTDLWSMDFSGSVTSILPLDGVNLALDASFQSAAMLKALGKDPIDISPLEFHLKAGSTDANGTIAGKVSMQMAESSVVVDLTANNRGPGPVVKGGIASTLIRLQDLRDGLLAATDIAAEIRSKAPVPASEKRPVTRSQRERSQDDVEGITIGLFDLDHMMRNGDVNIAIKFSDITGKSKIKGIDANLVMGQGKASLGPLKFSFEGGHFDLFATIDTIAAPNIVRLKGAGDGWDLGTIMKMVHVKIPASGTINAEFDVSGKHTSVADFISTLNGSTTLRMKNARIATSLLDLAGLGVVPWLFSKDRREDYATITCLRAPLVFKDGVVNSQEAVVETPAVQLVVYGSINIPRRTINIAGQPRPIGKPLKRSPWPFTLTGSLTDPKVKVKDGPSRVRRADGATKMPAKRVPCVPDILQLK